MKFKKLGSLALCVGMLFSTGVTALANENVVEHVHREGITPYLDMIDGADAGLSFSGNQLIANYAASSPSSSNVTQIQITAYIQQYKGGRWVTIASEKRVVDDFYIDFNLYKNVERGYNYRVYGDVKACSADYCGTERSPIKEAFLN